MVIQSLERHTKLSVDQLDIRETIGMENPWNYRNKSQFQVGQKDGKILAGLYSMNSHHLINIDQCVVQHPKTNKAVGTVKKVLQKLQIPIYSEKSRKGIVRTIVARVGVQTGELQIVLITAKTNCLKKNSLLRK